MLNRLLLIFFTAFLSYSAFSQVNLTQGLIGKYCLNGDAIDLSENENHGTNYGASPTNDRFGNSNAAMSFNGTTNYIQLSNKGLYNPNFTYSLWYNVTSNPANSKATILFSVGGNTADQIFFIGNNYFSQHGIGLSSYYSTSGTNVFYNNSLPAINEWHHLVFVRSTDSVILYVDGVLQGGRKVTAPPQYSGSPAGSIIGGRAGHPQYFSGKLDDLWIYNRAISYEEVKAIYNYNGSLDYYLPIDTFICGNTPVTVDCGVEDATYLWSNGARTKSISVATPGNYWVTVNKNCVSLTKYIQIWRKAFVQIEPPGPGCLPDSLVLHSANPKGTGLIWNTGQTSNSIYVHSSGVNWVEITEDGCTFRDSVNVNFYSQPDLIPPDAIGCEAVGVVLNASRTGVSNFNWNTGETSSSINAINPGTYIVSFRYFGCLYYDTTVLSIQNAPAKLGNDTSMCNTSSILLDIYHNDITQYQWHDGSSNSSYNVTSAGTYWVQTTANGCVFRDSIEIEISTSWFSLGPDKIICPNEPLTLNASLVSSPTYLWNTGETSDSIIVSDPGMYWVEYSLFSCVYRDTIILLNSLGALDLGPNQGICMGDNIVLDGEIGDGVSYLWNTGAAAPTLTVSDSGEYILSVVTTQNCTLIDTVIISRNPEAEFSFGNDTAICINTVLTLSPGTFASYLWNDGSTQPTLDVSSEGVFSCTVTNDSGCTFMDELFVRIDTFPSLEPWKDTLMCLGTILNMDATIPGTYVSYKWSTGAETPQLDITQEGNYQVTINHTCTTIRNRIKVEIVDCDLILFPSGFSPNNDGLNDTLYLEMHFPKKVHIEIFNRWGERVFVSDDPNFKWDGTYQGKRVLPGLYLCHIRGLSASSKNFVYNNMLHIIH